MESPRVFISYAHADRSLARSLATALSRRNVRVWIDEEGLRYGDSIIDSIAQAISAGDFLVAIVSPASLESPWCKVELAIAASLGIKNKRVVVLPVRYQGAEMPPHLRHTYWADADATEVSVLAQRIARDIDRHRGIEPSSADADWLSAAMTVFHSETSFTQERWFFHLKGATLAGRASVRIDGSAHYNAAEQLARLGALEHIRTQGSWRFYELTPRGRELYRALAGKGLDERWEATG